METGVGRGFLRGVGESLELKTCANTDLSGCSLILPLSAIGTIFAGCVNRVNTKSASPAAPDQRSEPHPIPQKQLCADRARTRWLRNSPPLSTWKWLRIQVTVLRLPATESLDFRPQESASVATWVPVFLDFCTLSLGMVYEEKNEKAELLKDLEWECWGQRKFQGHSSSPKFCCTGKKQRHREVRNFARGPPVSQHGGGTATQVSWCSLYHFSVPPSPGPRGHQLGGSHSASFCFFDCFLSASLHEGMDLVYLVYSRC